MSLNPLAEVEYRYRLAKEHLDRASKLFSLKDWVGTVMSSQLAVENFAKAVIALFEVPTWGHDPSNQLMSLIGRVHESLAGDVEELSAMAERLAPEHGKTSYGEPSTGSTPSELYGEQHASDAYREAEKAKLIADKILAGLGVEI